MFDTLRHPAASVAMVLGAGTILAGAVLESLVLRKMLYIVNEGVDVSERLPANSWFRGSKSGLERKLIKLYRDMHPNAPLHAWLKCAWGSIGVGLFTLTVGGFLAAA